MTSYTEYRDALAVAKAFESEVKELVGNIINAGGTDLPKHVRVVAPSDGINIFSGYHVSFGLAISPDADGKVRAFVEPWNSKNPSYTIHVAVPELAHEKV